MRRLPRILRAVLRPSSWDVHTRLSAACVAVALVLGGLSLWWNRIGWCPWLQDLTLNAAMTVVTVPFTAVLVEWLIEREERRRWEQIALRGRVKAAGLGYAVANAIAQALGVETPLFEPGVPLTSDQAMFRAHHLAMLRLIEERLLPAVAIGSMGRIPRERQDTLLLWFADLRIEANQTIVLYGRWLAPPTQETVLELESHLSDARIRFRWLWAEQYARDHFHGLWGVHRPLDLSDPGALISITAGALLIASDRMLRAATEHPDLSGL